jgi:hypothetical protein
MRQRILIDQAATVRDDAGRALDALGDWVKKLTLAICPP